MGASQSHATIRIGHSPDPDDAFMFYGFASGKVRIPNCSIQHVLRDIQTLNELAAGPDPLEVTAISAHAFLSIGRRYDLLEVGTSVGRGYGPKVVGLEAGQVDDLAGKRVALPGARTTATLVARRVLPRFEEVHLEFSEIIGAILRAEVDAGVIIHEGQLTYREQGLHLLADLGDVFMSRHGTPLPLGVNCVRGDLSESLKQDIADAYRRSVMYALENREQAVAYALDYARGLPRDVADRFIGMYVNEDSLHFGDDLRRAMEILRSQYLSH